MDTRHIVQIIILLLLWPSNSFAQKINFNEIQLPSEIKYINNLLAHEGVLYIATPNGLFTFSGKVFNKYSDPQNEESYRINTICRDKGGNLWFGTYNGTIVKFSNNKIQEKIDLKKYCDLDNYLISSISIDTILQNKNTEILLSTSGGEIFGIDTITQIVRKIDNPGSGTIFSIKYGYHPLKWLCTADGFYSKSKNSKWKRKTGYYTVYHIAENNNKYWGVGRDNEKRAMIILYYNDEYEKFSWKEFDLKQIDNKYLKFNELAITSNEIVWIATESGLVRYNPKTASLSLAENADGIDLKALRHIAIESDNIIWTSSAGRKLIQVVIE